MILTELRIHQLRNIANCHLKLNPKFNFFIGPNGSGKTSILEAFYLLSCGHSFRSREITPLITYGETLLTVFARGAEEDSLSIQKSQAEATQIKVNNQPCFKTSELAYACPSQIFYSDIFQIIDAGPSVRRELLDWGLFHVKHEYLNLLKTYKRLLKHRNALLKTEPTYSAFIPWDLQMNQLANTLHLLRQEYFYVWQQQFDQVLGHISEVRCHLSYYKGWDRKNAGKELKDSLEETFLSDKLKCYTQYGPHQADILIETNDAKAKHGLSRGQQKIILISMKLAQANLLEKSCLYLFDDFSAELDAHHQQKLMGYLANHTGQYVITSTQPISMLNQLKDQEFSVFMMDCGEISIPSVCEVS